jgi:hypothetical protein
MFTAHNHRSRLVLGCKHLSIVATHRDILGETMQYTLCVALPSGLPEGLIVLKRFFWEAY